jgi:hypothetical protein
VSTRLAENVKSRHQAEQSTKSSVLLKIFRIMDKYSLH